MTCTHGIIMALLIAATLEEGYCVDSISRQEVDLAINRYTFGWEVDGASNTITFDVRVKTLGFVGFGIASKANMDGADIVIGGVFQNGTKYFADYNSEGPGRPAIDESQDWILNDAWEDGEYTYLNFSRLLETCDEKDFAITSDTLNVIWSYGETDDISKHKGENRGGSQFNLLDPESLPFDPSSFKEDQVWKVRVNDSLLPVETSYLCTIHQFPKFETKHQIVALEAYLEDDNSKQYTHHFSAASCDLKDPEILAAVERLHNTPGMDCYGEEYMKIRPKCNNILFGWAKGGKRVVLPDYLGLPVGQEGAGDDEEYIMFEVHYDNPDENDGVQFVSGFDLYFTDDLREVEGSILLVGTNILPSLMIPPNQEEFTLSGHCSSEYTKEFIPEDGLNVVIVNMHSHLAGRELRVRHYRDGKELPPLLSDSHFDFDYQQARLLPEQVKILPGDHLTMECKMSTKDRNVVTIAGDGTRDEMCHAYLFYYPKIDLLACRSYYPLDLFLGRFGIQQIEVNTSTYVSDPHVTLPVEHKGKRISQVMNEHDWTDSSFVDQLQHDLRYGEHISTFVFTAVSNNTLMPSGPLNHTRYPDIPDYVPLETCDVGGDLPTTTQGGAGGNLPTTEGAAAGLVFSTVLATFCIMMTLIF